MFELRLVDLLRSWGYSVHSVSCWVIPTVHRLAELCKLQLWVLLRSGAHRLYNLFSRHLLGHRFERVFQLLGWNVRRKLGRLGLL